MNGMEQAYTKIEEFLKSEKRVMLLTGTHQYKKHKLLMAVLNETVSNASILFRTNGMDNLTNYDFLGFAGLKKRPKSGEFVKIGKNYYTFDSLNKRTWDRSGENHDFSILYPLDSAMRSKTNEILENVIQKSKGKIFLVSWTDTRYDSFNKIKNFIDERVIYDAFEEDSEYHQRVLDLE